MPAPASRLRLTSFFRSARHGLGATLLFALVALVPRMTAQTAWTMTRTNLPGVTEFGGIAYGNGRFVATLVTQTWMPRGLGISTDGLTWRLSAFSPVGVGPIIFAGGAFYLGEFGKLWRSTDGDTWQQVYSAQDQFSQLATDGRSMIGAFNSSGILSLVYSTDLTSWRTTASLPESIPLSGQVGLGYLAGRYYVNYGVSGSANRVSSTADGLTWTSHPTLAGTVDLTSGNGRLVGRSTTPSNPAYILDSTDGQSFTNTTINPAIILGRMTYAGGRYFFLWSLQASTDARTWAPLATFSPTPNGTISGIAYGNGRYVAVGTTGSPTLTEVVAVLAINAPPVIVSEPAHRTVTVGSSASFSVGIDNSNLATTYQWLRDGIALSGATTATLTIGSVGATDFGSYTVRLSNSVGTVTSAAARLAAPAAPTIVTQPASRTVNESDVFSLSVVAEGTGPFSYQWSKGGVAIPGATLATLQLGAVRPANAGTYQVVVSNAVGPTASATATLTVRPTFIPAPVVLSSTPPPSGAILAGERVTFSITVDGTPPLSIQWQRSGQNIPGATNATLVLDPALPSDLGTYQATVSNPGGSTYSTAAPLIVTPISRICNLSILTSLSAPGEDFSLGFVVGGIGTSGTKPVIARAAGPSLVSVGVTGALDDPALETFAGPTSTGTNDNWGGGSTLASAFTSVGAFPFAASSSKDAAVLSSLAAGDNSVKVTSTAGTGAVLAEVYDASPALSFIKTTPRLLNVSVLKSVGSGFTVGFTLAGWNAKTILIRAVGPTLGAAPFNVAGVLSDPQLRLFAGQTQIASNDNWGGSPFVNAMYTDAFAKVGAFALPAGSRDAAWLTPLEPGGYSVQVSGVGPAQGLVLVEIYEVP